jgi:SAM-dependent methyltransferase
VKLACEDLVDRRIPPMRLGTGACPLCGHAETTPSWLGAARFQGRDYPYVECRACGSHYCQPMPDAQALADLYGPAYQECVLGERDSPETGSPGFVLTWLSRVAPGKFVDYGCGRGHVLVAAAAQGWDVLGIEFDRRIAAQTQARIMLPVRDAQTLDPSTIEADVVHLGDVIEHLTDMEAQMSSVVRLLRPGGLLLAQGPLEANVTMFTLGLRVVRFLGAGRAGDTPPYHVIQATSRGQKQFFERWGFDMLEFRCFEIDWPAPSRFVIRDVRRLRSTALFLLRRASRGLSALTPDHPGNRYVFAGRRRIADPKRAAPVCEPRRAVGHGTG